MDITIKIEDANTATMTIDGQRLRVKQENYSTKLLDMPQNQRDLTLGGILAGNLFRLIDNLFAAIEVVDTGEGFKTWDELPEALADAASDCF